MVLGGMHEFANFAWFFAFALGLAWSIQAIRLYRLLERDHVETWISLGRPTVFRMGKLTAIGFITRQHYQKLGDPNLRKLGRSARFLLVAALTTFLFASLLILYLEMKP